MKLTMLIVWFNMLYEFTDTDIRLAGSRYSDEGRLEVNVAGMWGTVCDNYFDNADAAVACRMLGHGYVSKYAGLNLICSR